MRPFAPARAVGGGIDVHREAESQGGQQPQDLHGLNPSAEEPGSRMISLIWLAAEGVLSRWPAML